ncbi:arginine deiminase [Thermotomaculum hydrothermale]|uniref:arginine deiminase n=1 Tax=Thermotomaculum hydrothermale TaxID=981385 RepID=A0A7R6SYS8_9BACT|nr:arginine deiminase family protein [Thermotomaculum hydrothermale]BBB33104.1 arginine deiminase [Thermotomaculum hydrothermale]
MTNVRVCSEVGVLEKVVIHSPGKEIEVMTPETAQEVLYNDILTLPVVAEDHKGLKNVLKKVTRVYELKDLLKDILKNEEVKRDFVITITALERRADIADYLMSLPPEELADAVVCGVEERRDSLEKFLSNRNYALPPLPNLYFTRDISVVFRGKVITGSMANKVRIGEAVIARFIYKHHPEFKSEGFIFDGILEGNEKVTIEGGDFLVLDKNVVAIGVSERTTPSSIDIFVERMKKEVVNEEFHVFAVVLPKERSTIHLDMVFTMVDKDKCVCHYPYLLGKEKLRVIHINIMPSGKVSLEEEESLLDALKKVGIKLEPIICGGSNPVNQKREQWLSGTNFFAFAPGKIIGYACNYNTFKELEKAGFKIVHVNDIVKDKVNLDDYEKVAVGIEGAELARGGGGVRCMTMPVKRKPIKIRS